MIMAAPTACTARAPMRPPAAGRRRPDAADDEDGDADEEQALPSEPVGELAGRQQQRGQQHGVEARDPLRIGEVEPQVADDVGQGDPDDRPVEDDHPEPRREHREGDPGLARGSGHLVGRYRCAGRSFSHTESMHP
jgi:hypothetical protein